MLDWQRTSRHPAFPFRVKILAVEKPLSLQVHPSRKNAENGFAREQREDIAPDAPNRNFSDTNHKPEAIVAITEFRAFVGFSPSEVFEPILRRLDALGVPGIGALTNLPRDDVWPFDSVSGVAHLAELSSALRRGIPGLTDDSEADRAIARAIDIARRFPDDASAAITLVLNYCVLESGDVIYVPAGTIHSYLSGLGLEIMATSDNVLRAGMTTKHVDIPALLESLSTAPTSNPILAPHSVDGVSRFEPPVKDFGFAIVDVDGSRDFVIKGPSIVVTIDGEITLVGDDNLPLRRGAAAVIERGEVVSRVLGHGRFVTVSAGARRGWLKWLHR
jgi:mannose-6-phosphate isomerase